ncbi:lipopolysaccharide biosynthesis protein [Leisingera sp. ANG-DT]|uniref:lipopolysaccharide biosynthesis protein n=1 Tax=Leisingera sp. ANG-DT TaxID=1577897 RepID=UPI00058399DF|nr:lipopolysaccharide biosynthesis protein [Leisingera sp. ANG-DT]KIC18722.1 hypothetical protein RA21_04365 [Leisingera sp. ANG-DT]
MPMGERAGERLVGKALAALALRVLAAAATYAMVMLLGRWLSVTDYGRFVSVISFVTLMTAFCGLGLPISLLRYLGQYNAAQQRAGARMVMRHAARRSLAVSSVCAAAGILCGGGILLAAGRLPDGVLGSIAVQGLGLILLPAFVSVEVHGAMLRSFGRIFLALAPRDVIWRLLLLPAGLAVALSLPPGQQFPALLAAGAVLLAVLALLQARVLWRLVAAPRNGSTGQSAIDLAEVSKTTRSIWVTTVSAVGFSNLDVVAVAVFISPEQAGPYFAASRTAALAAFTLNAVNTVIGPRISAAYFAGDLDRLRRELRTGASLAFVPALAAFVLALAFGEQLLAFLGPDFVPMYPVLVILAAGHLANGMSGSCGMLLNMTGHEKLHARISFWALAAGVCCIALCGYAWGVPGIAAGAGLGLAGLEATLWTAALRKTGFDASVLSWLRKGWRVTGA